MTTINRSALVPYAQSAMYQLVNDVAAYPGFLPGCAAAKILTVDQSDILQATSMQASITLAKGPLTETFVTENKLSACERIDLSLVSGPFKRLHGHWIFTELDKEVTKVSLQLNFEFGGVLAQLAFARVFEQVAGNLVDAFCQEARRRY